MKVIFLDIDGVLNCKKTPNPRKLPYIVDRTLLARCDLWSKQVQKSFYLQRGGMTRPAYLARNTGAYHSWM